MAYNNEGVRARVGQPPIYNSCHFSFKCVSFWGSTEYRIQLKMCIIVLRPREAEYNMMMQWAHWKRWTRIEWENLPTWYGWPFMVPSIYKENWTENEVREQGGNAMIRKYVPPFLCPQIEWLLQSLSLQSYFCRSHWLQHDITRHNTQSTSCKPCRNL